MVGQFARGASLKARKSKILGRVETRRVGSRGEVGGRVPVELCLTPQEWGACSDKEEEKRTTQGLCDHGAKRLSRLDKQASA